MKTPKHNAKKIEIHNRQSKCLCGCKGSDSWHKRSYIRTVRNIRWTTSTEEVATTVRYNIGGGTTAVTTNPILAGEAKFPWGIETVVMGSNICLSGQVLRGLWYRIDETETVERRARAQRETEDRRAYRKGFDSVADYEASLITTDEPTTNTQADFISWIEG